MKIMDINLDPNPPQKGEVLTVTMKAILCEFYAYVLSVSAFLCPLFQDQISYLVYQLYVLEIRA